MAYVSLYRKWRPRRFSDVIGQQHVVRTLSNALSENRIAHAYLFSGPRGTGKTTVARLLAKGLNCVNGPTPEPCDQCPSCVRIADGVAMDVVEIDGASNRGIDEIRDVRERVRYAPTEGKYKIYIIDEVHMLTNEAFNALLKVLEEPPAHVVFVFATTEPHKIPATVASRCQRFDFRRLSTAEVVGRLKTVAAAEGIAADDDALALIARYADGSLRDSLGLLDQARAYADKVTAEVVADVLGVAPRWQVQRFADVLAAGDTAGGLALIKELQEAGRDLRQFLKDAARYLRDVLLVGAAGLEAAGLDVSEEDKIVLQRHAAQLPAELILEAIDALAAAESDMRWAVRSSLPLEMAVIRLTKKPGSPAAEGAAGAAPKTAAAPALAPQGFDVAQLLQRIERLEAMVAQLAASGAAAPAAAATPAGAVRAPVSPPSSGTPAPAAHAAAATSSAASQPAPAPSERAAAARPGPSAAPAAGAAPSAAPGADRFAVVAAAWDRVHQTLRERRHLQVQAFLREGRPVAVEGDTLIIEFPPDRGFHRASLDVEANRRILEGVIKDVTGLRLKVKTATAGEHAAAERPDDPAQHPAVKEALRVFGGRIVAIEDEGGGSHR